MSSTETGCHYVAHGLGVVICLPQPPKCWDYRCEPSHLARYRISLKFIPLISVPGGRRWLDSLFRDITPGQCGSLFSCLSSLLVPHTQAPIVLGQNQNQKNMFQTTELFGFDWLLRELSPTEDPLQLQWDCRTGPCPVFPGGSNSEHYIIEKGLLETLK